MEENTSDALKNSFLARGCNNEPKPYQKNENLFNHRCCKLDTFDWLKDIPLSEPYRPFDCAEVRFKNSRKDFFKVPPDIEVEAGDIVAVESSPGHDIGIVSLTGDLVRTQMKKKGVAPGSPEVRKIYRKARLTDIEKWIAAVEQEDGTMIKARGISKGLNLEMKVNDVEYQGDNTKAIFYYTAEERVDFRELIKILAEEFKVRIEMRQIGVRQEASRLGGIGTCGRELCCATWLTDFQSVTTNSARVQQLSLNPQKLAGQCGKLKCCLNFEYATYLDALKDFPNSEIILKTAKGEAVHQKTDIFKKVMWYAYLEDQTNFLAVPYDKVKEIIAMNAKGKMPEKLEDYAWVQEQKSDFDHTLEQDDLTRFDE